MTDAYAGSPLQSGAGSVGEEPREISLQAERLLIAYGEAVAESNLKDIDGGSENAELALRNYIATLESRSPSPLVSVEPSDTQRLDWLMEKGAKVDESNSAAEDGTPWLCRFRTFERSFQGEMHFFYGATARAAIDAAMEADNGK